MISTLLDKGSTFAKISTECSLRYDVHLASCDGLQLPLERDNVKQAATPFQLDQQVQVAIRPSVTTGPRAEDPHPDHAGVRATCHSASVETPATDSMFTAPPCR